MFLLFCGSMIFSMFLYSVPIIMRGILYWKKQKGVINSRMESVENLFLGYPLSKSKQRISKTQKVNKKVSKIQQVSKKNKKAVIKKR